MLHFTPLVPVFDSGYEMIAPVEGDSESTQMPSEATLQRALFRAAAAQLTELETRMTFLATTASVTPFIGLFGTVWGVMGAFSGLADAAVGTLQAVAPGMAEALIATAFGFLRQYRH